MDFDDANEANHFEPPAWLGREVSDAAEYTNAGIAIGGVPDAHEEISNAGLNALLDNLEARHGGGAKPTLAARPAASQGTQHQTRPGSRTTGRPASAAGSAPELSDDETIRQLAASLAPLSAAPH